MEKKIKFFTVEMQEHGISAEKYSSDELKTWIANQRESLAREHHGTSLLDYWETIINERHKDYQSIKVERDRTAAMLYQAVQRRYVIEKASEFFNFESRSSAWSETPAAAGVAATPRSGDLEVARRGEEDDMSFRHIAGELFSCCPVPLTPHPCFVCLTPSCRNHIH
jgi:arsenate reductase-like glutaredoxin family protein